MAAKDDLGRYGEELAVRYLTQHGFSVIDRNWRCSQGEIDVIARHDGAVVFVEVKTRSSTSFGHPFEAITFSKLARMRRLAAAWCEQADSRPGSIRIDAIAIIAPPDAQPTVEHLEGVFR
jgi:Predicted endonuclease distantly related to archaeal Holliday junction resolvase